MSNLTFRPLKEHEIQCRAQSVKKNGWAVLLYKDARCDMNILDETVGVFGWKKDFQLINNSLFCTVSIKNEGEWISKQDVGSESNTEAEKGQASDAFKRACFNWGIDRELYTAPFIWISANSGEVSEKGGKFYLDYKVKLSVYSIEVNDGIITSLTIVDQNDKVRYKMGEVVSKDDDKKWLDETDKKAWMNAELAVKSGRIKPEELREHYKVSKMNMEYFESLIQ
jgi:hypothetical protein